VGEECSVEISRFKKILGEKVRGKSFEKVIRYVLGMLILLNRN